VSLGHENPAGARKQGEPGRATLAREQSVPNQCAPVPVLPRLPPVRSSTPKKDLFLVHVVKKPNACNYEDGLRDMPPNFLTCTAR